MRPERACGYATHGHDLMKRGDESPKTITNIMENAVGKGGGDGGEDGGLGLGGRPGFEHRAQYYKSKKVECGKHVVVVLSQVW